MKPIVVYNSNTGFTEQYAMVLSEQLHCPCTSLKKFNQTEWKSYDCIVFGGWIMGSMIMGLDKLRKMKMPASVFAVGCTPAFEEVIMGIKEQNHLGDIPLFYLEGGMRLEKLGFPQKLILKAVKKATLKKQERTRQEDFMVNVLGTSFDHYDPIQLEALIDYVRIGK